MKDSDTLDTIRADAEVAVLATLRSVHDDCEVLSGHLNESNVLLDLIGRALDALADAAASVRCIRDEVEMSIRADAREALSRL